jgi:hypothetical protein
MLDDDALVVLFPEDTSSNGDTVWPFHSSLLEPVAGGAHEISTGRLHYSRRTAMRAMKSVIGATMRFSRI